MKPFTAGSRIGVTSAEAREWARANIKPGALELALAEIDQMESQNAEVLKKGPIPGHAW